MKKELLLGSSTNNKHAVVVVVRGIHKGRTPWGAAATSKHKA
jgi:hypothetical protein